MAKHINDIINKISDLNINIKQILYQTKFEEYDDLSELEYDKNDKEELFLLDELYDILNKLSDISHTLDYLNRPIKDTGKLHKNSNGRYELKRMREPSERSEDELNGHEFTSGCGIEYLANDNRHMTYNENDEYVSTPYWCSSYIEHNGDDYYIVGALEVQLEGLLVRYR